MHQIPPIDLAIGQRARIGAFGGYRDFDGHHVYAIDNSRIGKYHIADGRRVARWIGEPAVRPKR